MNTRNLTSEEIAALTRQGCTASEWQRVTVAPGFRTEHVRHVRFSGDVRLGVFEEEFRLEGGLAL